MKNNIKKYAKYVAFLLIVAGSFSSCEKEEINPDQFKLKKIIYSRKSSSTPTDGVEYSYNEAGNMVLESFFKYDDLTAIVYKYREYEYLENKKVKMKYFEEKDKSLQLSRIVDFFYDNDRRLIKEEICNSSGRFLCSMNYEYKGNNMIREYYYEPDYGISNEVKYTFDGQNRLVLEEYVDFDDEDDKRIKHIYDNIDRKIKIEYYDKNLDLLQSIEIIYNGRSKLPVKEVHYNKNGIQTLQYEHFYDKRGNLTETRIVDGCTLFKRKYDGGLLMEETVYSGKEKKCAEEEVARYEYEKI